MNIVLSILGLGLAGFFFVELITILESEGGNPLRRKLSPLAETIVMNVRLEPLSWTTRVDKDEYSDSLFWCNKKLEIEIEHPDKTYNLEMRVAGIEMKFKQMEESAIRKSFVAWQKAMIEHRMTL